MHQKIMNWVEANKKSITATYQHLHAIAEVSWEEVETTAYLCAELDKIGVPYHTFETHTGVVATWKGTEDGPVLALRADIDALWQNVNGEWKANHSCGHDAHATMMLYSLKCLKEIGFEPKGTLKVIFQPAEEKGNGAQKMIEQGVVDGVDEMIGIHVRPAIEMAFGQASAAIYHGATTLLGGRVKGLQAHGSRPNMGINVVDSLAAITQAVNAIKVNPMVPSSAKVTMVRTNGKNLNIIPDEAEFGLDLRAQTNEAMEELIKQVERAILTAGRANGAEVELDPATAMVAAVPCREMEETVESAIVEMLGETALCPPPVTPGGEDFHFYPVQRPQIKATVIGLGTDLTPGLHHPLMTFNLDALQNGVKIIALSACKRLSGE